jgi:hypothetical protein
MTRDPRLATTAEIVALTARLRHLRSPEAIETERAAFDADRDALLARLPDHQAAAHEGQIDPARLPALAAEMVDGITQRSTEPARADDPAELQARLADLHARITDTAGAPAGGWRTVSAEQAAQQLTARGYDPDTARGMVIDYLRDTSQRVGAPAYAWGLDQGDIDAITAGQDKPLDEGDHEVGEAGWSR